MIIEEKLKTDCNNSNYTVLFGQFKENFNFNLKNN